MSTLHRIALAGLLLGVAACSQTGDETRTLSAAELTAREGTTSAPSLTPGERTLRRQANSLLGPTPQDRLTADAYAEELLGAGFGSGADRYDRLMSDIAADGVRIDAFLASAEAVLAADRSRGGANASAPALSQRVAATIRINENRRLVRRMRTRLAERLDLYRQALGQLVLAEPGQRAIAAEEAITDLAWRLRRLPTG